LVLTGVAKDGLLPPKNVENSKPSMVISGVSLNVSPVSECTSWLSYQMEITPSACPGVFNFTSCSNLCHCPTVKIQEPNPTAVPQVLLVGKYA
jgi:hypothetical protein